MTGTRMNPCPACQDSASQGVELRVWEQWPPSHRVTVTPRTVPTRVQSSRLLPFLPRRLDLQTDFFHLEWYLSDTEVPAHRHPTKALPTCLSQTRASTRKVTINLSRAANTLKGQLELELVTPVISTNYLKTRETSTSCRTTKSPTPCHTKATNMPTWAKMATGPDNPPHLRHRRRLQRPRRRNPTSYPAKAPHLHLRSRKEDREAIAVRIERFLSINAWKAECRTGQAICRLRTISNGASHGGPRLCIMGILKHKTVMYCQMIG
ncbi:hypothetical protein, variant 7 [Cladophialophora immunda]|uniref:Uncharacterized protein n=1 Tax=Cladophialophora immunda TaxID=569365 RepID=A0A0D2AP41_9EURO|nr:uncharacterized protein PV07_06656 [Cladophialophora immunda]XP_016247071.1 hypothetical protein, variant 1 [Cladophialophora immunda]XP_016247072.1 hypothetical protein, variant 2 [Cladophialophora immunda]XP_016247073.1 hypothetical protein, variant 3 [Cladophialophora immunda]XP_016247074.1 hypothetical protein, variant 4 [Cladophialophora immunda]XP_016247075.1 hypothetical protein, variant 5 [Cladophialophora immunda]XP_016247076.1 hypothetical protein, variant 6 [Cladophialophora imm